jgi:hypothetical protein
MSWWQSGSATTRHCCQASSIDNMTEKAALTFDTPMSSVEVVEQLWAACDAWSEKEKRFEALADAASRPGSRLLEDNAATVADGESLAVADYM